MINDEKNILPKTLEKKTKKNKKSKSYIQSIKSKKKNQISI